jgi:heat shock protein 4
MSSIQQHANLRQDWLYDEGDDATKAQYIAKFEEIRFVAGPVIGRYNEKQEEERQKVLKAKEEAAAKKRAEEEVRKKAADEAKKAEAAKKGTETPKDTEMTDAEGETVKADAVEEK